jgi:peroxiredoxin
MNTRTHLALAVALGAVLLVAGCADGWRREAAPGVAKGPEAVEPPLVGSRVPDVTLWAPDTERVDLRDAVSEKPTILVIYRGNWCVYCQKQLADLQKIEPKLLEMGYQIIAVSPDRPDDLHQAVKKHNLKYALLSDSRMEAAKALGLAYHVDAKTRRDLERFGVPPQDIEGQLHYLLPVPAVFIVDTDGTIQFSYANPDYRVRVDPDVLLAAAKAEKEHREAEAAKG